jgi:myo-inositol-1(or 4)-monophosphatase
VIGAAEANVMVRRQSTLTFSGSAMIHSSLSNRATSEDAMLLSGMIAVARTAGEGLLETFSAHARPTGRDAMFVAGRRNEERVASGLRRGLTTLHPHAAWLDEDLETTPIPDGEWWVVDAVEGNVNHVHGMNDWAVSITLLRDRQPVATVVHQPLGSLTWTARRGGGAACNGRPLQTGSKTALDAAVVTTGQAEAGHSQTHLRIGNSITAMLGQALLVRMAVPSTFPMIQVATGQNDVFWQYGPVLPGVAAGWLIVTEAGGLVTRIDGSRWEPGAPDILVTSPGLHDAAVTVLSRADLEVQA